MKPISDLAEQLTQLMSTTRALLEAGHEADRTIAECIRGLRRILGVMSDDEFAAEYGGDGALDVDDEEPLFDARECHLASAIRDQIRCCAFASETDLEEAANDVFEGARLLHLQRMLG